VPPNVAVLLPLSVKVAPLGSVPSTDRAGLGYPVLETVNGSGGKGAPTLAQVKVLGLVIVGAVFVPAGRTFNVNT
jgi:hypothetical protein